MSPRFKVSAVLDERELATLRAALKLWRETANVGEDRDLMALATDCGHVERLDPAECTRLGLRLAKTWRSAVAQATAEAKAKASQPTT